MDPSAPSVYERKKLMPEAYRVVVAHLIINLGCARFRTGWIHSSTREDGECLHAKCLSDVTKYL